MSDFTSGFWSWYVIVITAVSIFGCGWLLWRTGKAKDTGQPGPTWTVTLKDGTASYCTGPEGPCDRHPAGPFSIKAITGGLYRACSEAGACGEVDVDRGL